MRIPPSEGRVPHATGATPPTSRTQPRSELKALAEKVSGINVRNPIPYVGKTVPRGVAGRIERAVQGAPRAINHTYAQLQANNLNPKCFTAFRKKSYKG